MNKIFKRTIAVLTLMCTFILCSCNHSTQNEPTSSSEDNEVQTTEKVTEPPTTMPDSELNLMQRALLSMDDCYDISQSQYVKVRDMNFFSDLGHVRIYYVDVDKDEEKEVCVVNGGTMYLFHEIEGKIYTYTTSVGRGVFTDGTIWTGSLDGDSAYCRINDFMEFVDLEYLAAREIDENGKVSYYTDKKFINDGNNEYIRTEIDEAEFNTIMQGCEFVEAEAFVYTDKNIKIKLADWQAAPDEPVEYDGLNLMQKVLLAKEDIIDVEDGQAKKIHQLQYFRNGTSFYYVDLDKDGKNEVILEFADWSILHEIDGKIYRYKLPYSAIVPMFKDGTMYSSSTASEWFLWRIAEFGEKDIVSEYIYYAICDKDAVTQYYSFNGIYGEEELLTDEELELIRNQYKEEKARKYTLGSVDILNIVSDYE